MPGLTFKQFFPTWEHFRNFLIDYSVYYEAEEYSDQKALVYYTLLYRQYANSNSAYDNEIFLEKLSLTIAENFREFFQIRELLDFVNSRPIEELITGVETITNVGEKPNEATNKDTIVNFIGVQTRSKSKENIVDRVNSLVRALKINEVSNEVRRYEYLFLKIIPREFWIYAEDPINDEDD